MKDQKRSLLRNTRICFSLLLVSALTNLTISSDAYSAGGALDPTFGNGGKVFTDLGN